MFTRATTPRSRYAIELHHKLIDVNARAYVTLSTGSPARCGTAVAARDHRRVRAGLAPARTHPYSEQGVQIASARRCGTSWEAPASTSRDGRDSCAPRRRLDRYPQWLIADVGPTVTEVLKAVGRNTRHPAARTGHSYSCRPPPVSRAAVQQIGRFMAKRTRQRPETTPIDKRLTLVLTPSIGLAVGTASWWRQTSA